MKPAFGTLEWSKKNNGVLTRTEQFHFLRNMAFLAAREVTDVIRAKLGLLKPVSLDLSDLAPPDTRMVKDTEEFARDTHTQDLLSHGYRTYYFGAMIAAYRKLKYDKEVYFSAAILHDIGLTESRISPLTVLLRRERWSSSSQLSPEQRSPGHKSPNSWRRNFGTPQFAFACSQVRRGGFTGGERCRLRLVWL
jgi:hypothetical protein